MSGEEMGVLAEEQASLRRVATLVARGAPSEEVFATVTEEVGRVLPVDFAIMGRFEDDATVTCIAVWGEPVAGFPIGSRWGLEGTNLVTIVLETGRPARVDRFAYASGPIGVAGRASGFRSTVGTPIIVDGRLWGVMCVGCTRVEPLLPTDTEPRLVQFTELLATAVANAESRAGLAQLAEEQAALRRVATLVARAARPEVVFAAVTEEVGRLLPVDFAGMARYEPADAFVIISAWSRTADPFPPAGSRWPLGGANVGTLVFETGRSARVDRYAGPSGPVGVAARETGFRSSVGTPIVVESRLWGVVLAGSTLQQPLPADTEARLASFTELVATAIANAESRTALAASRARVVAAADETRRRIERDLHDGAQQRLVSLMLELRAANARRPSEAAELAAQLAATERELAEVLEDLREISRGIHPVVLSRGGLRPALTALARRSPLPIELDLRAGERLPEHVKVATYYVVSEALTNAVTHAHASAVSVELHADDEVVSLVIKDDGVGGADMRHGSGLVGLSDRVEALGGRFQMTSPTGTGTTLLIQIPSQVRPAQWRPSRSCW